MKYLSYFITLSLLFITQIYGSAPWGKDADLVKSSSFPEKQLHHSLSSKMAQEAIHFHQNFISPADGPRSNYIPSSSQYTLLAIRKYGFLQGFFMGCDRLIRENSEPWVYSTIPSNGKIIKYDPVK